MGTKYTRIKEGITQVVLIVFSVVLGLYLSERIEERKKRQESQELLTTIKSEVKDNIRILKDWAPYHQEINKSLDSLSKQEAFIAAFVKDKDILYETLLARGSFMKESLASDAWDIAKSHPLIMNIDHNQLIILSKVYNQQKGTFEPMSKMFDVLSSKNVNKKEEAKANLESISRHVWELAARERQLMYYYKKAAEILDLEEDKETKS